MMNNYYYPSPVDERVASYNYPFEYSSPSTYYGSPMVPSACPVHSPLSFYPAAPTPMNLSPYPYPHQPQLYSPPVQPHPVDRTPLRRHRCFKKHELQILHQSYVRDSHPSTETLQQLATQLNVSIDKVRQWFKNRRHSDKQKRREVRTTTQPSTST